MQWREFFGLSRILSEKEFLEMEIQQINKTNKQILIAGYDKKFFINGNYILALQEATERGIKIGVVLHINDPPSELEELTKKSQKGEFHKCNKDSLINNGFRTFDKCFVSYYDKTEPSKYQLEKNLSFFRDYIESTNFWFRIMHEYINKKYCR